MIDCLVGVLNVSIDGFRCSLTNFSIEVYKFNFGYICMAILGVIIFISLFGGIRENYRWFILNQACLDLLLTYEYICGNNCAYIMSDEYFPRNCFFYFPDGDLMALNYTIGYYVRYIPSSAIFLLVASRFVALFFPLLYERFTHKRRIFHTIFGFNLFILFIHLLYTIPFIVEIVIWNDCKNSKGFEICMDEPLNYNGSFLLHQILSILTFIFPILLSLFTIIATPLIIFRILKQAKFQREHNPKDFASSLRVAAVLLFQTVFNSIILIMDSANKMEELLGRLGFAVLTTFKEEYNKKYHIEFEYQLDLRLPHWFAGSFGLIDSYNIQMAQQLRVFFDSIIVLILMTGYREFIFTVVKMCFFAIIHPEEAYKNFKAYFNPNQVTNFK